MRPLPSDYPFFYKNYVLLAAGDDATTVLAGSLEPLERFLRSIPEEKADHAYAPDKWTIKQVLQHCIDTERIFAYRALCHARGEEQSLPGFEQTGYAANANVDERPLQSLCKEMLLVRKTTTLLFQFLRAEDLNRVGTVGGNPIKTLSWAFIISGHWQHHQNILREKYGV